MLKAMLTGAALPFLGIGLFIALSNGDILWSLLLGASLFGILHAIGLRGMCYGILALIGLSSLTGCDD